jgi:hypothetical protein
MNDGLDQAMSERFARQHDELPMPDFADVLRRATQISARGSGSPEQRREGRLRWRVPTRIALVAAVVVIAGGTATAFAVRALTQSPVTQGFSALTDPTLPEVTPSTAGVTPHFEMALRDVLGADFTARQVGDVTWLGQRGGMFLGQRGNALCEVVVPGAGQCTDHLDGDVWVMGDMGRSAETAPFSVHFYGFARDSVASIRVTTSNGNVTSVPVDHNAFQTTLTDTSFADITAIEAVSTSGQTTAIDPRRYFPATLPTFPVTTP